MWVMPCVCVVNGRTMLEGHDIHLVKMDLWDIGIGSDVDVFLRHKSEIDGWLFGLPCRCDDFCDVCYSIDGGSIHSNEDALTECRSPAGDTCRRGRRDAGIQDDTLVVGVGREIEAKGGVGAFEWDCYGNRWTEWI